jgi:hypothetical protein
MGKAELAMMDIPREIATCPVCGGVLVLGVESWDTATGVPEEIGCVVECKRWHPHAIETRMPYVYWLPVQDRVYHWAEQHVRVWWSDRVELVTPDEYDRRTDLARLAAWEAWAKGVPA